MILISPAKRLQHKKYFQAESQARFLAETETLLQHMKGYTTENLAKLFRSSEAVAELNKKRFESMDLQADIDELPTAVDCFDGEVYRAIDAGNLSETEIKHMKSELRILSGFYGLLRPFDAIHPYRLEMGTRFFSAPWKDLYHFWKEKLQSVLSSEKRIINLASQEYFKAVDFALKNDDIKLVQVKFLEKRDNGYRSINTYAKRARGLMARHLIQCLSSSDESLKSFKEENYSFNEAMSTANEKVFTREQWTKQ